MAAFGDLAWRQAETESADHAETENTAQRITAKPQPNIKGSSGIAIADLLRNGGPY